MSKRELVDKEIRIPATPSHVDSVDHEVYELGGLTDDAIRTLGAGMTQQMLSTAHRQRKEKAKMDPKQRLVGKTIKRIIDHPDRQKFRGDDPGFEIVFTDGTRFVLNVSMGQGAGFINEGIVV